VWIIVEKLAPSYYRKLDQYSCDTGRYRELPSWRKAFKRQWKKLAKAPINGVINPKYRPDSQKWVCTCPYFVTSRFLICKHLVQSIPPVPPTFFLEVKRNRTTPFWLHHVLQPDSQPTPPVGPSPEGSSPAKGNNGNEFEGYDNDDNDNDDDDDGDVVDTQSGTFRDRMTFRERFLGKINGYRDFLDGLEYQLQFEDERMLETVEREGAGFWRLAQSCLSRERRMNTSRGSSPVTWERETSNAMFYRTRPRHCDRDS
jgi:hypothetical protein